MLRPQTKRRLATQGIRPFCPSRHVSANWAQSPLSDGKRLLHLAESCKLTLGEGLTTCSGCPTVAKCSGDRGGGKGDSTPFQDESLVNQYRRSHRSSASVRRRAARVGTCQETLTLECVRSRMVVVKMASRGSVRHLWPRSAWPRTVGVSLRRVIQPHEELAAGIEVLCRASGVATSVEI